jgi:hypothetical protein
MPTANERNFVMVGLFTQPAGTFANCSSSQFTNRSYPERTLGRRRVWSDWRRAARSDALIDPSLNFVRVPGASPDSKRHAARESPLGLKAVNLGTG